MNQSRYMKQIFFATLFFAFVQVCKAGDIVIKTSTSISMLCSLITADAGNIYTRTTSPNYNDVNSLCTDGYTGIVIDPYHTGTNGGSGNVFFIFFTSIK